jgi:biopolymer transport protein ExbD
MTNASANAAARIAAGGDSGGVNLAIIITPMLDMAFQLLAFFVMTYHPNALEGHINGKLLPPLTKGDPGPMEKKDKDQVPSPEIEPDLKDNFVVVVKAVPMGRTEGGRNEGEPTRIQLKRPESAGAPDTICDTDTPFAQGLKKLESELEKVQSSPSGSKSNIAIEADPDLRHMYVVQVYDVCKKAGFKGVGFVPPPLDVQGR